MNYVLESLNLNLRPCAEADVELLLDHWTKPLVRQYLFDDQVTDRPTVVSFVEQSKSTFETLGYGLWMLTDKVDGGFRGVCGCLEKETKPDLLFSIEPDFWGNGLATESALCVIAYLSKTSKVKEIIATVDKPNTISIAVLEKLGMQMTEERVIEGNPILFYALEVSAT